MRCPAALCLSASLPPHTRPSLQYRLAGEGTQDTHSLPKHNTKTSKHLTTYLQTQQQAPTAHSNKHHQHTATNPHSSPIYSTKNSRCHRRVWGDVLQHKNSEPHLQTQQQTPWAHSNERHQHTVTNPHSHPIYSTKNSRCRTVRRRFTAQEQQTTS